jgi:Protein of unknown function (DUF1353)
MTKLFRLSLVFFFLALSHAYADTYEDLKIGTLKGKVLVQWLEPDIFLFIPDSENPLHFIRYDGARIQPKKMLTDGGSVPRPIWAFKKYSPWGYAPAFIIHDWLFHLKGCKLEGYEKFDLNIAADVMGEIIKTMMETGKVEKDPVVVDLMTSAVRSKFAKEQWDGGRCNPAPAGFGGTPISQYTLEFD